MFDSVGGTILVTLLLLTGSLWFGAWATHQAVGDRECHLQVEHFAEFEGFDMTGEPEVICRTQNGTIEKAPLSQNARATLGVE